MTETTSLTLRIMLVKSAPGTEFVTAAPAPPLSHR
jgi:hypothetical protein